MAIFKVGDRVRIVGSEQPERYGYLVGREATILGRNSCAASGWFVDIDGNGPLRHDDGSQHWFLACNLQPLTPPGQKEFKAEDILTLPNLPDWKPAMTPEFARAWGGA